MSSLNDHIDWEGNIKDVVAMSIRDSGRPVIDLTRDEHKAGPSGAVMGEPADEDCNFFQY
jgi:hypothetical protein